MFNPQMNVHQSRRVHLQELMHQDDMRAYGFEDDPFFREMSKQVSKLIEEDDVGFGFHQNQNRGFHQNQNRNVVAKGPKFGLENLLGDQNYYDWPVEGEVRTSPPAWLENLWWRAAENGTGVFIPQQVQHQQFQSKRSRYRARKKTQQFQQNQQGRATYYQQGRPTYQAAPIYKRKD